MLGVTVRTFSCGLQSQERHLADIQHQLEEAHRLEENMKRDLKRISKDIDVLQRQDLDVRNEISTQKKRFLHQRSVQVQTNVTIFMCLDTLQYVVSRRGRWRRARRSWTPSSRT